MKNSHFYALIVTILAAIISACSNELPDENFSSSEEIPKNSTEDFKITESEALAIADKATGHNTRNGQIGVHISPIYSDAEETRASDATIPLDTIAYIVNYDDEQGFSIISKDN